VPIVAVVSDKQKNIVNAIKAFNPEIPHIYCQFHFLKHLIEPVAAKDSYLKTKLKKAIYKFSIVANRKQRQTNDLYELFYPVSEELMCAVSTRGDRFKTFPGVECFLNLEHVLEQLKPLKSHAGNVKIFRSLNSVIKSLTNLLKQYRSIYEEIVNLIPDIEQLRKIFAKRRNRAHFIRKNVKKWTYMLQNRLKRRNIEEKPEQIKWKSPNYKLTVEEIWQEWIRLVDSYQSGLFIGYDDDELELTNNPKEQLIYRSKHHFRALLGRENISRIFQEHGGLYSELIDIDFSKENISEILLACETPFSEQYRKKFRACYATVRRTWRIREINTGNIEEFKNRILDAKGG